MVYMNKISQITFGAYLVKLSADKRNLAENFLTEGDVLLDQEMKSAHSKIKPPCINYFLKNDKEGANFVEYLKKNKLALGRDFIYKKDDGNFYARIYDEALQRISEDSSVVHSLDLYDTQCSGGSYSSKEKDLLKKTVGSNPYLFGYFSPGDMTYTTSNTQSPQMLIDKLASELIISPFENDPRFPWVGIKIRKSN